MRGWYRSGIFRRTLLSILVVSIVPLFILGSLALRIGNEAGDSAIADSRAALDAKAAEALEVRAVETANQIALFLQEREADLRTLAQLPRGDQLEAAYLAFDQAHRADLWLLEDGTEVHRAIPLYPEIAYVDRTGQEVVRVQDGRPVPEDALRDVSDPANTTYHTGDYFAQTKDLARGEIYVSHVTGPYVSRAEFEAGKRFAGVLYFAMPVYDLDGAFDGIVVLGLDSRALAEFTEHIVPTEQRFAAAPDPSTGNYAYMIDNWAYTLAHPNDFLQTGVGPNGEDLGYAMRTEDLGVKPVRLDQLGFSDQNLASIPALVAAGKAGSIQYTWSGHDKFLAYAPIPFYGGPYGPPDGFGWVGIGADVNTFHAAANQVGETINQRVRDLGLITLVALVLTTAVVLIVAGLLARQVADPLQRITEAARSVERGEFDLGILDPLAHRRSGGEKQSGGERQSGGEIGHLVRVFREMAAEVERREQLRRLLDVVISIGVALPKEQDFGRLLETVVTEARQLCHADTGALYLRTENDQLEFVILQSGSGHLALGGTTGQQVPFPPIPLYDRGGAPNHAHIASHTVHTNATVNVADVSHGFSDVKAFDQQIGYQSQSLLSVPLKEDPDNVIGVLQLTNAQDAKTGQIIAFNPGMNRVIESLAALGTVALKAYMQRAQLQQQIRQLQIEIDLARQDQEVREITEADYFQRLQERAQVLRKRRSGEA